MPHRLIVDQSQFEDFCAHLRKSKTVAFDSEFVSEYTYQPQLCLLQFATPEGCVAVDPYQVENLESWWDVMTDDETTVVVHGGQAEVRFCLTHAGRCPRKLIDVQIAEGLRSRSYPLGYSSLVARVLGRRVHGKETRTDWRRRPLSPQQIQYALEDVKHILEIWKRQRASLESQNRIAWAEAEFRRMIDDVETDQSRDSWQRVSGIQKLNSRELAVACELSDWREQRAAERDRPFRQVLRDDLLIELARRQPKSIKDLLATRDLNRGHYKQVASDFLKCVECGLAVPESDLPEPLGLRNDEKYQDEHVLAQLLGLALSNRCAEMSVSRSLVGTSADLRHLVRGHVQKKKEKSAPRLTQGWRAEVCGDLLTDLLEGKISLRVANPQSDHPLVFEPTDSG